MANRIETHAINRTQSTQEYTEENVMRRRSARGTGSVEAIVGAIILVPIALGLLDLIILISANSMNDVAVKNAARAAANQADSTSGFDAANKSLISVRSSTIVKSIVLEGFDYPLSKEAVTVSTRMTVHLPVPFPGLSDIEFVAKDVEPIVAN